MASAGPFSMSLVVLLIAVVSAAIVGIITARRYGARAASAASLVVDMAIVGAIAARVGFVLMWLPQYVAEPLSILRIGDGGFLPWAGILAAAGYAAWRMRREPMLRRPVTYGAVAGIVIWVLLGGAVMLAQRSTVPLPQGELRMLDGGTANLATMTGKPLVVNLWATWCPPCRREMPVLAQVQDDRDDVTFAFVNQGEDAERVARYLESENLQIENVLLDGLSSVSQQTGARGLPTTLFFDADGQLVDVHVGELTQASLIHKLKRFESEDEDN